MSLEVAHAQTDKTIRASLQLAGEPEAGRCLICGRQLLCKPRPGKLLQAPLAGGPLSPAPRCSPLPAPAGHTRGAFSRPTTLPGASRRAHGKAGSGAWKAGVWQLAGRPGERLGGSAPSLPACSPVPVPCLALVAAGGNKAKDRPSRRPLPRWGGRARPPGCGCRRDARSASAAPHRAARPRPLSVPLPLLPRLRGGQKGAGEGETFLLVLF